MRGSTREVGSNAKPFLVMLGIAIAVAVYFGTGMPGMDHGSELMAGMSGHHIVDAEAFADVLDDRDVVTINVHVPTQEITLPGTDAEIPFDALQGAELPEDRDTMLAVYCKSGNMSATAVRDLLAMGYTDVIELGGGTDTWATAASG